LQQVLLLLLLLVHLPDFALLLILPSPLSLGHLVSFQEQTGDIAYEVVVDVVLDHPCPLLLAPVRVHVDRLILVVRVEQSVDLQETLKDRVLNCLIDQNDRFDILVQGTHTVFHELGVFVEEKFLLRELWEVLCGAELQVCFQLY